MSAHTGIITVEHKSDQIARRSGRVFIEYRQKGRRSGIATSKADFYAIEFDFECWIVMPLVVLKNKCRRVMTANPNRAQVRGGDFKQYEGVLVKLTELL